MGEMTHKIEVDRLNALIDKTAQHWLALQSKHPIAWEGAIDEAMAAACDRIEALEAEVSKMADNGCHIQAMNAELGAENARLRAGMEAIKAVYDDQTVDIDDALSVAGKIATAALKDTRHAANSQGECICPKCGIRHGSNPAPGEF